MITHPIWLRPARAAAILVAGSLAGCGDVENESPSPAPRAVEGSEDSRVLLRVGISAESDQRSLHGAAQPVMDYLGRRTGFRVEYRMGRSSERTEVDVSVQDLIAYVEERVVEIAPLGPLGYCIAQKRFGALPLARARNEEGEPFERTLFVASAESPVRRLGDLEGRSLALGPSHSTFAHLVALHELDEAEVPLEGLSLVENLPSETAVLDAVRGGSFSAGAIPASLLPASSGLRVVHRSEPLPTGPMVVRADLPEPIRNALREALLELEAGDALDPAFENGFAPVAASDYDAVRRMLDSQGGRCTSECHEPLGSKRGTLRP